MQNDKDKVCDQVLSLSYSLYRLNERGLCLCLTLALSLSLFQFLILSLLPSLFLSPVGDPGLDAASNELAAIVSGAILDFRMQQETYLIENKGKPGFKENFKPGQC
jgi:hypothetical protein